MGQLYDKYGYNGSAMPGVSAQGPNLSLGFIQLLHVYDHFMI